MVQELFNKAIFGLVLLSSGLSYACPNLTGTYTCKLSVGDIDFSVKQETDNQGITTYYFFNSYGRVKETLVANGMEQKSREASMIGKPGDYIFKKKSYSCSDDTLFEKGTLSGLSAEGKIKWTIEMYAEMRLDKYKNWQSVYFNLSKNDLPDVQTCRRKM